MSNETPPAIDRPFEPQILADAERIVSRYRLVLWREDGNSFGRGVELPDVYGDGPTPAECVASTLAGLTAMVAHLLETGEQPPAPDLKGVDA